jgi:hypothetical protein
MPQSIRYRTLCQLSFPHDYFLNVGSQRFADLPAETQAALLAQHPVTDWLDIIPDTATQRHLGGIGIRMVFTPLGFRLAVRVDADDRPFAGLPAEWRLRFGLRIRDPYFANYTALRLEAEPASAERRLFYFSNEGFAGAPAPDLPDLTREPPTFSNGADYPLHALVRQGSNYFLASRAITNSANPNSNNSGWINLGNDRRYVSRADELAFLPALSAYRFATPNLSSELVVTDTFGREVLREGVDNTDGRLTQPLRRPLQAPGRYRRTVVDGLGPGQDEVVDFYLHPRFFGAGVYGIVELGPNELLITTGNPANRGKVKDPAPEFRVPWLNRFTQWRYFGSRNQDQLAGVDAVDDPRPLTYTPDPNPPTLNGQQLPVATAARLASDTTFSELFSDTYVDERIYN